MSTKTVQRCRELLIKLGFAAEVVRGRHLTRLERQEAREQHGSRQDRAASVRALTQPQPAAPVENVHPPRRGLVKQFSRVFKGVKHQHAQARAAEESPKIAQKRPSGRNSPKGHSPRRGFTPWPTSHINFARRLQQRMPALQRYHPATICKLLAQSAVNPDRWTVESLLHVLELSSTARGGLYFADRRQMRSPLAYTATVLKNSIDPLQPTPLEIREQELAARAQRRQLQRDEVLQSATPEARAARDAFFADRAKATPPRRRLAQTDFVRTLIGSRPLHSLSRDHQLTIATLTRLHRRLVDRGWDIRIDVGRIAAHSPTGATAEIAPIVEGLSWSLRTGREESPMRAGILVTSASGANDSNSANDGNRSNRDNGVNDTVSADGVNGGVGVERSKSVVDTNDANCPIFVNVTNDGNDSNDSNGANSTNADNSTNHTV